MANNRGKPREKFIVFLHTVDLSMTAVIVKNHREEVKERHYAGLTSTFLYKHLMFKLRKLRNSNTLRRIENSVPPCIDATINRSTALKLSLNNSLLLFSPNILTVLPSFHIWTKSKFSANMTSSTESQKSNHLNFPSVTYPFDILVNVVTENVLIALQWEAIVLRTVFCLHNKVNDILTHVKEDTFARLKRPEIIVNERPWERIDVQNAENVPTKQQAGQKKGKRRSKSSKQSGKKRAERAAKREAEERERLREWEECWEKKLQAEEERDNAECCVSQGLCVKPRTQSNIWINVTRDRSIQEIHMTFKHAPVPRPKPPPLPPLSTQKTLSVSSGPSQKGRLKKVDKKVGTGSKKTRTNQMRSKE